MGEKHVEDILRYVAGDYASFNGYSKGSLCGEENLMRHWPGSTCRKFRPNSRETWCWPCKAADALGRPVPELAEFHRGPYPGVSKEWESEHHERIHADRVRLFGEAVANKLSQVKK